jgi:hypothetical protein
VVAAGIRRSTYSCVDPASIVVSSSCITGSSFFEDNALRKLRDADAEGKGVVANEPNGLVTAIDNEIFVQLGCIYSESK